MKCPLNVNMRMKKPLSIGFVALLLLAMAIGVTATDWDTVPDNPTPAQSIWVDPKSRTGLGTCSTFVVDILVNVTDPPGTATGLFGFQYRLKWDSTVLDVVEITTHSDNIPSGDILPGWTMVFVAANDTTTPGYHFYAVTAVAGVAFTGVGALCTYTFHVTASGNCTLDIYDEILVDDTATPIDHTTRDGYINEPLPRAIFTYDPEFPAVDGTVTFNATESFDPDGTIVSYAWDFGDLNITTVTDIVIKHAYTAAGVYNVTLTVTDNDGLNGTTWRILGVGGPFALFTYDPPHPGVNETITFNASESFDTDGTIVSYTWDFGDGNTTTIGDDEPITPIIKHAYTAAGVYNVTLTVTDNASDTGTTWDIVKPGYPVADFYYSPDYPIINETVTFDTNATGEESSDPDGTIVSYAWDFGDLNITTVTDIVIKHAYTAAGVYNVTLTVTDNDGLNGTTWDIVKVRGLPPVADFTYSPLTPLIYQPVTFNASESFDTDGTIVSYAWDFGDGNTTTIGDDEPITPIIKHAYTAAGDRDVTLTVIDNDRLGGTVKQSITIAKLSSSISIFVSLDTIEVDEDITISGDIDPDKDEVTVTIYFNLTDGAASNTTVTTNSTGGYSYTWTPEEAGTYDVYASWLGDANTEPDESSVIEIEVKEKPAPLDWLLYVGIAIVIIIVAAIAIYFLKIRKS